MRFMFPFPLLCTALMALLLLPAHSRADQLQWITPAQARHAMNLIPTGTIVVLYCSHCDDVPLTVVEIDSLQVIPQDQGFVSIAIEGSALFRSVKTARIEYGDVGPPTLLSDLDEMKYHPIEGETIRQEIDLAYVYWPRPGGWQVLGRSMGLECAVSAEWLSLPRAVLEQLARRPAPPRNCADLMRVRD